MSDEHVSDAYQLPEADHIEAMRGMVDLPDTERTPCEVWTRVIGYHRPVSAFNPGKQSEHNERKHFREASVDGAREVEI